MAVLARRISSTEGSPIVVRGSVMVLSVDIAGEKTEAGEKSSVVGESSSEFEKISDLEQADCS